MTVDEPPLGLQLLKTRLTFFLGTGPHSETHSLIEPGQSYAAVRLEYVAYS